MNDQKRLVDRNHMATHAYVVPGYTKDSGQRLRQPEVKKTRRGNVTISYGKFKVNHPIVGLSLIDTYGIFSDLYITGYTRLSICMIRQALSAICVRKTAQIRYQCL